ncbi:unnamed protein product [Lactuca saligna]|uniref:Uncharacterized protein n=1 Tax=Lactuca saligna TaxID=75948 RepID=A0AA35VR28_LACSI|nr:unnamed protein product [Lactuca saligna]
MSGGTKYHFDEQKEKPTEDDSSAPVCSSAAIFSVDTLPSPPVSAQLAFFSGASAFPASLLDSSPKSYVVVVFTLKVIGNMIMSLEPEGEEQEKFRDYFKIISSGEEQEKFRDYFKIISSSFASLPFNIPGTAFYHGTKARDGMFEMLDTIIARRRNGSDLQQDLLGSLIKKHIKEGSEGKDDDEKLTDAQMKDNVLTLLIAGHDTTSLPLHVENQAALDQLKEEHMEIRSKRKSGSTLTWSEVNNMPYTTKKQNKINWSLNN